MITENMRIKSIKLGLKGIFKWRNLFITVVSILSFFMIVLFAKMYLDNSELIFNDDNVSSLNLFFFLIVILIVLTMTLMIKQQIQSNQIKDLSDICVELSSRSDENFKYLHHAIMNSSLMMNKNLKNAVSNIKKCSHCVNCSSCSCHKNIDVGNDLDEI